jgi:hypothetical protein
MIIVSVTYSIVTNESAENGDVDECGFRSEREEMSFREIVRWMRGGSACAYPPKGETREWVRQDQGETHEWFEYGEREERCIHFHVDNPARNAKYWAKAMRYAGLMK